MLFILDLIDKKRTFLGNNVREKTFYVHGKVFSQEVNKEAVIHHVILPDLNINTAYSRYKPSTFYKCLNVSQQY